MPGLSSRACCCSTALPARFIDCIIKVDLGTDPFTVEIVYLGDVTGQIHIAADIGEPEAKWKNILSQRIASLSGTPSQLDQNAQAADWLMGFFAENYSDLTK